jgi:hypothetical protein
VRGRPEHADTHPIKRISFVADLGLFLSDMALGICAGKGYPGCLEIFHTVLDLK